MHSFIIMWINVNRLKGYPCTTAQWTASLCSHEYYSTMDSIRYSHVSTAAIWTVLPLFNGALQQYGQCYPYSQARCSSMDSAILIQWSAAAPWTAAVLDYCSCSAILTHNRAAAT